MKQGIQTNFPHEVLRKYGCYFFCLAEWASRVSKKEFTENDLINFFDKARDAELIRKDCTILNPPQILNLMVGIDVFSMSRITTKPPIYKTYIIYLEKPYYGHFILCDDRVMWDPLDPERPGAAGYTPISYREIA